MNLKPWVCVVFTILCLTGINCTNNKKILSEQEYVKFANQFENAVYHGKTKFLENTFYLPSFEEKYLERLQLKKRTLKKREVKNYRLEIFDQFNSMINSLLLNISHGGLFKFTRFYIYENTAHLVFNQFTFNGVNYIDFELETISGRLYIVDFYSYYIGENFSDTFRKHVKNKVEYGYLAGPYMNALEELNNIKAYIQRGQYQNAWTAYNRISQTFRDQKSFQTVGLTLSKQISNEAYLNMANSLLKSDSSDQRFTSLHTIYLALSEENPEVATQNIDQLKNYVGEDILLKLLEGETLQLNKDYKVARKKYAVVLNETPDLFYAYIKQLEILLASHDYPSAIKLIKNIENKFEVSANEWNNYFSDYPEFLKSKEYLSWNKKG